MARIHIRLLASLFALAVLVGTGLGAYYIYRKFFFFFCKIHAILHSQPLRS